MYNKKNLLILAVVAGGAYYYFMKMKKDKAAKAAAAKAAATPSEAGFTGSYFNASGGCMKGVPVTATDGTKLCVDWGKGGNSPKVVGRPKK